MSALFTLPAMAESNLNGETGYINMPNGRVEADGTLRMGYSFAKPYVNMWSSIAVSPRLEVSGRYTRVMGGAMPGAAWVGYGDYKDKVISGKFLLLEEDWHTPSVAIGMNDVMGTGLFKSQYIAASKKFGALDTTLGIGSGRISGAFAGARYSPAAWDGISLVAEYDANNYQQDFLSTASHVAQRKKGVGVGLEYRWGWITSQLGYRDGKPNVNAYASIPLEMKDFVPNFDEPAPDTEIVARPTMQQWQSDPQYRQALVQQLLAQNFKNIHLDINEHELEITLTNTRIALASRSVGRAVRTLLLRSPLEIQSLRVNYTVADLPVVTYHFSSIERLQKYFAGLETRKQLAPSVSVGYADKQADNTALLDELEQSYSHSVLDSEDGNLVSYRNESAGLNQFRLSPGFGMYFNDPSGAFRYEVLARALFDQQLADGLFFKASASLTLSQNISGVTQASNSLLPHVRTDVASYKKTGNLKLNQALLNQFYHADKGIYARASAGLYEEMFGGAGGQVLYFPERAPWAVDIAVDALKQRDVGGGFAFRPYSTVTALASLHYRLPINGVTATVRGGRFLAGDLGGRFEMKRRFRSGFEVGAWYTLTNGNDITMPGAPTRPYHDKGVFLMVPLDTLLPKDTQTSLRMPISPWTRDVGQMVASPTDLYDVMESTNNNLHDRDGLQYFSDLDDSYDMPRAANAFDRAQWSWDNDPKRALQTLKSVNTWKNVGLGLGLVAFSSTLDKSADRWAAKRMGSPSSKGIANIGNNLPLLMGGVAGLLALEDSDPRLSKTSFSALEAGVMGVLASETGKYIFGRSRPQVGKGVGDFHPLRLSNGSSGFPSGHTTAMWAMVTPYAQEYRAPWLYGIAALTNLARVTDRKHFVSDTVGGSLLGYALGTAFWSWHKNSEPQLTLNAESITLTWHTD
ncbi:MAG: YjbH domain-containing protein [Gallionella sp.]|nr:YjbH domain-containing protein [Gallionella sp.]MDD4959707.1 YjbH domain-containing protein [Gallionella sp.]